MARDIRPAKAKRCYACIQWEGNRTYLRDKNEIKVDIGQEGNCLLFHIQKTGNQTCDKFVQLQ